MLGEVIAEGGYYGMQTFDQHLLEHLQGRAGSRWRTRSRTASSPHDFKLMVAAQSRDRPALAPEQGRAARSTARPREAAQPHPAAGVPRSPRSRPPHRPSDPPAAPPGGQRRRRPSGAPPAARGRAARRFGAAAGRSAVVGAAAHRRP